MFEELGIKTVPVTLKGSPLAKIAINIILGEPMLPLAMWHTASQEVFRPQSLLCNTQEQHCAGLFRMLRQACMWRVRSAS